MFGLWKTWKALEARGIMGINRRNADYVLKYNKRSLYPIVDDKIITKERAIAAGIHVPELYGVISTEKEIDKLDGIIGGRTDFVIKPAGDRPEYFPHTFLQQREGRDDLVLGYDGYQEPVRRKARPAPAAVADGEVVCRTGNGRDLGGEPAETAPPQRLSRGRAALDSRARARPRRSSRSRARRFPAGSRPTVCSARWHRAPWIRSTG